MQFHFSPGLSDPLILTRALFPVGSEGKLRASRSPRLCSDTISSEGCAIAAVIRLVYKPVEELNNTAACLQKFSWVLGVLALALLLHGAGAVMPSEE